MGKLKEKLKNSKLLDKVKELDLKNVLDVAGNFLPDKGGLGVIKNIIQKDDTISAENKVQLLEAYEDDMRAFELEVQDRDSARKREVELAKVKGTDWMMYATGIVGLVSFIAMVVAVIWIPSVQENKLFVHLMGIVEGVVISNLFAYYYGTSKDKT
ncbi:MAG: hypothetical protein HRU18_12005 [Pseudoalteromonas sp.]|uniref:hypothetical protein n=1 Tax=Pseudoalteromonas sp. TaxID=53249 RepID=UPI001D7C0038|nr:hypothetical protein [Pseudoalteromonas sp.]NRA78925.1 hypothetical protein [Pseudoalteromonas sp.]